MRRRGRKRAREDDDEAHISPPRELPAREASAVADALERWRELRARAEELRPVLQREDSLMQEILDRGLRHEDRRTLRRLVSGNSEEVEEEVAQQVAAAIGAEMEALQAVLVRNRRELLELSATTVPERKRDLVSGLDAVRSELQGAQDAARGELLAAKERGENAVVRSVGRSFNDLKALLQRVEGDRRKLTRNSALAALLVTVCRRVLPVRHIDPSELRDIPPSHEGYLRIADFHLFSDSGLYDFGEHCSGPNLFTRLRRNVAILNIHDVDGKVVYNSFAVSGELKTAGAPPVPPEGPLYSIEAEDEHGRKFDRRHDAEFKLLSGFCAAIEDIAAGRSIGEKPTRESPPAAEVLIVGRETSLASRAPGHEAGREISRSIETSGREATLETAETVRETLPDSGEDLFTRQTIEEVERSMPPAKRQRTLAAEVSDDRGAMLDNLPLQTAECQFVDSRVAGRPPSKAAREWRGFGRLWSRKPLCRSCAGAVRQLGSRFPWLSLEVVVGEFDEVVVIEPASP